MDLVELFRSVELFDGLDDGQLARLAAISRASAYGKDQTIFAQGQPGDTIYIVREGFVEVIIGHGADSPESPKSIINLGAGQVFGEMALVDRGLRSATVRSVTDRTVVDGLQRDAFMQVCESDTDLGFTVMRNLSADLSFKLRHRNLSRR
jgi:CRP-like cAMP-binding protein